MITAALIVIGAAFGVFVYYYLADEVDSELQHIINIGLAEIGRRP